MIRKFILLYTKNDADTTIMGAPARYAKVYRRRCGMGDKGRLSGVGWEQLSLGGVSERSERSAEGISINYRYTVIYRVSVIYIVIYIQI